MLNLRKLQTFRVVADTHNFIRAAAQLGCCQSSVTTHIQALERELGVLLFDRCRRSRDGMYLNTRIACWRWLRKQRRRYILRP